MKRKKFLQLTSIGALGLTLRPLWENTNHEESMFSFPQMVGEVSQDSAILQTRLTSLNTLPNSSFDSPEVLVNVDIPGAQGVARFEIAENPNFSNALKTSWQVADADRDYIVKQKINGLKPGTRYYVRVHFGTSEHQTHTGSVNQFMTLPPEDADSPVLLVVSSCMNLGFFFLGGEGNQRTNNWEKPAAGQDRKLGYLALEAIEKIQPAFWVQTGDSVYYDHPKVKRAKTKDEMRAKWHRQMAMPRMHSLLQQVPVYWMIDDHDFRYNDSDNSDDGEDGRDPSPELGAAVFREQVPVVDPEESNTVTYSTRHINKLLQVWMMDGRNYRDPNNMPDGPQKSIWGKEQFEWLKQTLLSSNAVFKLLIVGTPLIGPDDAYKHDNHTSYGGFRYERDQFFMWLKNHAFLEKNFYIITGDRHWQYHSIHPSGFEEFGTGTITTQNARRGREPGDPHSTDPLGLITQPFIQKQPIGGFLSIRVVASENDNPALITFTTMDENGVPLNIDTKRANS